MRSAIAFNPGMYEPAQPTPATARRNSADQKPSAYIAKPRCDNAVSPAPARYTLRVGTRSVNATNAGTAVT